MARIVDLIREGAAPASIMRRAAQGGLSLPAVESIEVLVALAAHPEFAKEAELTLANWDELSLIEVASNATASPVVLVHLLRFHACRPAVVQALCENPSLPIDELETTARLASAGVLRAMAQSRRVCESRRLRELMAANPAAEALGPEPAECVVVVEPPESDRSSESIVSRQANETEQEDGEPFELVAATDGEDDELDKLLIRVKQGETITESEEVEQLSLLQRIAQMRVGERIKLAMRGNREERMVLIRDRSKLVSLAVLESPKVSDTEMESFASMKNIQEAVLRTISSKRNYMKNYGVVRALVNIPKTPVDVALPLIDHLLLKDQQARSRNKNVNETVRKMGARFYRMKSERKKSD